MMILGGRPSKGQLACQWSALELQPILCPAPATATLS